MKNEEHNKVPNEGCRWNVTEASKQSREAIAAPVSGHDMGWQERVVLVS
jgi:hypothetical protein